MKTSILLAFIMIPLLNASGSNEAVNVENKGRIQNRGEIDNENERALIAKDPLSEKIQKGMNPSEEALNLYGKKEPFPSKVKSQSWTKNGLKWLSAGLALGVLGAFNPLININKLIGDWNTSGLSNREHHIREEYHTQLSLSFGFEHSKPVAESGTFSSVGEEMRIINKDLQKKIQFGFSIYEEAQRDMKERCRLVSESNPFLKFFESIPLLNNLWSCKTTTRYTQSYSESPNTGPGLNKDSPSLRHALVHTPEN